MRTLALAAALVTACATPTSVKPPSATPRVESWASTRGAAHPLVGRAWNVKEHRFGERTEALAAVQRAHFVLLGEKHDNADHHRLQGDFVAAVVEAKRRPAIAFEQVDLDLQDATDRFLAGPSPSTDALATVLDWEHRGWPAYAIYRPIFDRVIAAHLPLVATGLGRDRVRAIVKTGLDALDPDLRARLRLEPLAPALTASLAEEIAAAHCGALPPTMIEPMSLAQRVKDAEMADRLVAQDGADGAILVAGNGHVRSDRGVPEYLRRMKPTASVIVVSLLEVRDELVDAKAYEESAPADWIVFTPRVDDDDPCASAH